MEHSTRTFATCTLGCKVNHYETQAIEKMLVENGYTLLSYEDKADIYIINTCTVTHIGDRKSRQMIRRAKNNNPDSVVVVTGCYAQTAPNEIAAIEGVDIICGTHDHQKLLSLLSAGKPQEQAIVVGDIMNIHEFEEMAAKDYEGHVRAYLKIQEGCNQFCSYCIIPYARGPIRSRSLTRIKEEAERLRDQGVCEIILTGIHVASYGMDFGDGTTLKDAVAAVNDVKGITRIRLSSIEPMTLNETFARQLKQYDKLCPHFHLSLQSGCDDTLKRMNRKYSTKQYANIVSGLREVFPDVSITTDMMVGFAGETDEEFAASLAFAKEMEFSHIHVFQYSRRKNTKAASYANQIEKSIKEKRSKELLALSDESCQTFLQKHIGKTMEVLFEQASSQHANYLEGKTRNYLSVAVPASDNFIGKSAMVTMQSFEGETLIGTLAEQ